MQQSNNLLQYSLNDIKLKSPLSNSKDQAQSFSLSHAKINQSLIQVQRDTIFNLNQYLQNQSNNNESYFTQQQSDQFQLDQKSTLYNNLIQVYQNQNLDLEQLKQKFQSQKTDLDHQISILSQAEQKNHNQSLELQNNLIELQNKQYLIKNEIEQFSNNQNFDELINSIRNEQDITQVDIQILCCQVIHNLQCFKIQDLKHQYYSIYQDKFNLIKSKSDLDCKVCQIYDQIQMIREDFDSTVLFSIDVYFKVQQNIDKVIQIEDLECIYEFILSDPTDIFKNQIVKDIESQNLLMKCDKTIHQIWNDIKLFEQQQEDIKKIHSNNLLKKQNIQHQQQKTLQIKQNLVIQFSCDQINLQEKMIMEQLDLVGIKYFNDLLNLFNLDYFVQEIIEYNNNENNQNFNNNENLWSQLLYDFIDIQKIIIDKINIKINEIEQADREFQDNQKELSLRIQLKVQQLSELMLNKNLINQIRSIDQDLNNMFNGYINNLSGFVIFAKLLNEYLHNKLVQWENLCEISIQLIFQTQSFKNIVEVLGQSEQIQQNLQLQINNLQKKCQIQLEQQSIQTNVQQQIQKQTQDLINNEISNEFNKSIDSREEEFKEINFKYGNKFLEQYKIDMMNQISQSTNNKFQCKHSQIRQLFQEIKLLNAKVQQNNEQLNIIQVKYKQYRHDYLAISQEVEKKESQLIEISKKEYKILQNVQKLIDQPTLSQSLYIYVNKFNYLMINNQKQIQILSDRVKSYNSNILHLQLVSQLLNDIKQKSEQIKTKKSNFLHLLQELNESYEKIFSSQEINLKQLQLQLININPDHFEHIQQYQKIPSTQTSEKSADQSFQSYTQNKAPQERQKKKDKHNKSILGTISININQEIIDSTITKSTQSHSISKKDIQKNESHFLIKDLLESNKEILYQDQIQNTKEGSSSTEVRKIQSINISSDQAKTPKRLQLIYAQNNSTDIQKKFINQSQLNSQFVKIYIRQNYRINYDILSENFIPEKSGFVSRFINQDQQKGEINMFKQVTCLKSNQQYYKIEQTFLADEILGLLYQEQTSITIKYRQLLKQKQIDEYDYKRMRYAKCKYLAILLQLQNDKELQCLVNEKDDITRLEKMFQQ